MTKAGKIPGLKLYTTRCFNTFCDTIYLCLHHPESANGTLINIILFNLLFPYLLDQNCGQERGTFTFMSKASEGAFTQNVKSVLSENLGGIWGGTQC